MSMNKHFNQNLFSPLSGVYLDPVHYVIIDKMAALLPSLSEALILCTPCFNPTWIVEKLFIFFQLDNCANFYFVCVRVHTYRPVMKIWLVSFLFFFLGWAGWI